MKTQSGIQDYTKRPGCYSNIDGTGDMCFGFICLGFVLYHVVQSILPEASVWRHKWYDLLLLEVVPLSVLGLGWWGAKAIKKHITYPRTGYVAYTCTAKRSVVTMIVAMVVSASAAAAFVFLMRLGRTHDAVTLSRLGMLSIVVATYAFWVLATSREHRWKWLIVILMALGSLAFSFAGWNRDRFDLVAMLFFSLTWLASGGITLYLYIRRTRPPTVEPE